MEEKPKFYVTIDLMKTNCFVLLIGLCLASPVYAALPEEAGPVLPKGYDLKAVYSTDEKSLEIRETKSDVQMYIDKKGRKHLVIKDYMVPVSKDMGTPSKFPENTVPSMLNLNPSLPVIPAPPVKVFDTPKTTQNPPSPNMQMPPDPNQQQPNPVKLQMLKLYTQGNIMGPK
jgi:hypothetical protein